MSKGPWGNDAPSMKALPEIKMIIIAKDGTELGRVPFKEFKAADWPGDCIFRVEGENGQEYPQGES